MYALHWCPLIWFLTFVCWILGSTPGGWIELLGMRVRLTSQMPIVAIGFTVQCKVPLAAEALE